MVVPGWGLLGTRTPRGSWGRRSQIQPQGQGRGRGRAGAGEESGGGQAHCELTVRQGKWFQGPGGKAADAVRAGVVSTTTGRAGFGPGLSWEGVTRCLCLPLVPRQMSLTDCHPFSC